MKEAGKFISDMAPIGTWAWAYSFKRIYGDKAYEEVREFFYRNKKEEDPLGDALSFAIRRAAEYFMQDPH